MTMATVCVPTATTATTPKVPTTTSKRRRIMDRHDETIVRHLLAVSRGGKGRSAEMSTAMLVSDLCRDSTDNDDDDSSNNNNGCIVNDEDFDGDYHSNDDLSFCTTIDLLTGEVTHLSLGLRVHRSIGSPMTMTTAAPASTWDLSPVVARLTSLQHLSLTGCRSLPVKAMSKTMTNLREICLIDCPLTMTKNESEEPEGNCLPSFGLQHVSTFSIQYNIGSNDHDVDMDGRRSGRRRRRSGSLSIGESQIFTSCIIPSMEQILLWLKIHCTGLRNLSISLKGPTTTTGVDNKDQSSVSSNLLPDMILKHLSPHHHARHSVDVETRLWCFNFFHHLESISLSGCGMTDLHLEPLLSDHFQMLIPAPAYSKIKRVSVDRNNIESLQFITQRIQEHHRQRQQQELFSYVDNDDDQMDYVGTEDTMSFECLRPPISRIKLEYLNLSDNPVLKRMMMFHPIQIYESGDSDEDGGESIEEKKELVALRHLLYMMPHLHYIGYPSHVSPILQRHANIDFIMRINRGGRWLVEHHDRTTVRRNHNSYDPESDHDNLLEQQFTDSKEDWFGPDREMAGNDGHPSVMLWPRILQRSYGQSSTTNGLAGGTSSVRPIQKKDASAMFFLLREGPVLLHTRRTDGDSMLEGERLD
mmetsp:Transcript_44919/g.109038  ORF Transcript_44919/g.109038 Transcript_44919/m.109038 type:complete len:642 (+) Transcript_44919:145-2070(+)